MSGGLQRWVEAQRMRAPAPTGWWYATFALGIGTLLFSLSLTQVFPQSGYAHAPGYGAPVIAFEFARSQADLLAVFGPESDAGQVARLAAMRAGNEQDYLFMLLYAAFVTSGLVALWRELRLRWLLAAALLPVAAALCDSYENWLLFDIQAAFTVGEYSPAMASLPWPVAAKFLLLAFANAAIGAALTQMSRRWQLAGTLILVPLLTVPMALVSPPAFGWTLTAAIGAGWIGLLGTAAIGCAYALLKKAPLVDFEPEAPQRRATDRGEPEEPPPPPGTAPRSFGRRKSDI